MFKKLLFLFLLIFSSIFFTLSTSADLGDFNDYSSDSSGGGWDSGGWDSDSYSGGYHGGVYVDDYGDDEPIDLSTITIIVIVIIVVIVISNFKNNGKSSNNNTMSYGSNINVPNHTEEIVKAICEIDENFSNEKFISWVKDVFITLQKAWSDRDFEKCRPFEKEELYNQHCTQIQGYKDRGWINKLDRINVNQSYLYKYVRDAEYEYLTVYIQARMSDYIIEEKTGNVIKGDPNMEYQSKYLYTFIRKTGVKTNSATSNKSTVACPHCGAPTNITSAGKCEYCGYIIVTGEFDWVLSNIESVKNNSNIDNGGIIIR